MEMKAACAKFPSSQRKYGESQSEHGCSEDNFQGQNKGHRSINLSLQKGGCTCLAKMRPFTITFLKGGCPKRAVASTSRV